jgi:glycosyltransferase involved in cell wall biosynthesis
MDNIAIEKFPAREPQRFGRVAIVHDWLETWAGSESVLEQIIAMWPEADLFTLVDFLPEGERAPLLGKRPSTSFIQRMPYARKSFRAYLPLMPLAVEQFDLSAYDVIISSSHAVAKGVIVGPDQVHVSYVHSPIRYAWDLQHQYLKQAGVKGVKGWLARSVLHYIRMWDQRTAHGVDTFVANSEFIGRRIHRIYGCNSTVVHPPVDVERFELGEQREDFYLIVSRMVPYKRIPLIVEAFSRMPERRLVVIGTGTEFDQAKAAAGPNITLLGYQPQDVVIDHMRKARAFVFAAEEDFGISVVEAQACGAPVIAFGKGGALETVVESDDPEHATGLFFHQQDADSIISAVRRFEGHMPFNSHTCRRNALRFTAERFRREFYGAVSNTVAMRRKNEQQTTSVAVDIHAVRREA